MDLRDLILLLPCYSLEDLSLDRDARDAEQLLAGWSALFHPLLLSRAGEIPKWERADAPPQAPSESLVVLPRCSGASLPDGWVSEASAAGARVIGDFQTRDELVAAALDGSGGRTPEVDAGLAADFLALGFCHFQVELLTRQLRYMSNLDEVQFRRETLDAAEHAVQGDPQAARDRLQKAFDLLTEAREYFYPVETYLLDLTLVTSVTLGEALTAELTAKGPVNLLISGEAVQQLALGEPNTLGVLRNALEKGTAAIIGGEYDEQELPLLDPEAILAQFHRGLASYDRYLDRRPTIFGRRRFGLSPMLPQILHKLGFSGAVHFTLDDGRFPFGNRSKIRWQGADATSIAALARLPLDAARHESFLRLPERLGDVMDLDHTATAVLAHWPGRASPWYHDLRRMADYSPVLGRFVSMTDYFRDTEHSGQAARYNADQYRPPYLRQSVAAGQSDPISRWVRYHRRCAAAEAVQTSAALAVLAAGRVESIQARENLRLEVQESRTAGADFQTALDDRLRDRLEQAAGRLAAALPRVDGEPSKGLLLVNPWSFPRRSLLGVSGLGWVPEVGGTVRHAGQPCAVVEVPPMGFAWVGPGREDLATPEHRSVTRPPTRRQPPELPPMAEENVVRNDYFEVVVDPTTGAIQSIHAYGTRGNRLAQQLAFRFSRSDRSDQAELVTDDPEMAYSVMAADDVSVISSGPVVGEIVARGRLVDRRGRRLAGYVQTVRAQRGSRVLELDIELDVGREPGPDPWHSYYAARFAWGDATADLYRSVSWTSQASDAARFEAPEYVDIRAEKSRTTILTGGLPFHRRLGLRKLDTLLVVRGETARRFRLGIGIDLSHPMPAALGFVAPEAVLAETALPPHPSTAWLFHLDTKNVIVTHLEPVFLAGGVSGFQARLLETDRRGGRARLRCFRPVRSARKTDFRGNQLGELPVQDDRITIDIGPGEWVQMEAKFR